MTAWDECVMRLSGIDREDRPMHRLLNPLLRSQDSCVSLPSLPSHRCLFTHLVEHSLVTNSWIKVSLSLCCGPPLDIIMCGHFSPLRKVRTRCERQCSACQEDSLTLSLKTVLERGSNPLELQLSTVWWLYVMCSMFSSLQIHMTMLSLLKRWLLGLVRNLSR